MHNQNSISNSYIVGIVSLEFEFFYNHIYFLNKKNFTGIVTSASKQKQVSVRLGYKSNVNYSHKSGSSIEVPLMVKLPLDIKMRKRDL